MNDNTPNIIKEYYIAYFDILGYKEFFEETPENALEFLYKIHTIITNTENLVTVINQSPIAMMAGNLLVQSKIFSDNILLCIEVGNDETKEKARVLAFMGMVSEIQRKIITQYGLAIRGSFVKGKMSINEKYVFGEGLIDAVNLEGKTSHPRIAVSTQIINILEKVQIFSQEDAARASLIEKKMNDGEKIVPEDKKFYNQILSKINLEVLERKMAQDMLYLYDDGEWCLSYLNVFRVSSFLPKETVEQMLEVIKQNSPNDYEMLPKCDPNVDALLDEHRHFVVQKLIKYSDYRRFVTDDIKKFDIQESILRKYVWSMVYHNYMCKKYGKTEYYISSKGDCERRHMKLVIHVLGENEKS